MHFAIQYRMRSAGLGRVDERTGPVLGAPLVPRFIELRQAMYDHGHEKVDVAVTTTLSRVSPRRLRNRVVWTLYYHRFLCIGR
jgi:hypothetical protein